MIAEDNRRRLTPDNYLRSQAEMSALFADIPEAIDNTVEIARRCSYYPKSRNPILPRFAAREAADGDAAVKAEAESCAGRRAKAWPSGSASRGLAPASPRRTTASGSNSSSASSRR